MWTNRVCCLPTLIHMLNLTPSVMVFGGGSLGGLGQEGGALTNKISALINETPESSLPPAVGGHGPKTSGGEPESGSAHQRCCHLDGGLPATRAVRSKCLLVGKPPSCDILLQQPKRGKTPKPRAGPPASCLCLSSPALPAKCHSRLSAGPSFSLPESHLDFFPTRSFSRYLLSASCAPWTMLGPEDAARNRRDKYPNLEAYILVEGDTKQQLNM